MLKGEVRRHSGKPILANQGPSQQQVTTLPAEAQFHEIRPQFELINTSLDTTNSERRDWCPTIATDLIPKTAQQMMSVPRTAGGFREWQ